MGYYGDRSEEEEIIRERIDYDHKVRLLREEVDFFRQSQLLKEASFFEKVVSDHPWFAEHVEDAMDLRIEETDMIARRRLGADRYNQLARLGEDEDAQYCAEEEGDDQYTERLNYWKQQLQYDETPIEIDPDDREQKFHLLKIDAAFRSFGSIDFRDQNYELRYKSDPDNFPNSMRRDSFQFWKAMEQKYRCDLINDELVVQGIDPRADFEPHYNHFPELVPSVRDAMNWFDILEERLEEQLSEEQRLPVEQDHDLPAQQNNVYSGPEVPESLQAYIRDYEIKFIRWEAQVYDSGIETEPSSTFLEKYKQEFEDLFNKPDDDLGKLLYPPEEIIRDDGNERER